MSCNIYQNRKTIIVGEVNSGKTERTLGILRELMNCAGDSVAVLDLAPERTKEVGGKIPLRPEERQKISVFSPRIMPPRLSGQNEEEVWALARGNARRIEEALRKLQGRDWQTLIINDVSLYLQAGKVEDLVFFVGGIPTLLMNGYYGQYFRESALSRRERRQLEELMSYCDQILYLPSPFPPQFEAVPKQPN